MGWQDRDYNAGGSGREYLANPLGIMGFALPFGRYGSVTVRLHFWLLLSFLFTYIQYGFWARDPYWATVICVFTLAALIIHEMGHRIFSRMMGGNHFEFVLWPAGGMVPPNAPPYPWAYFVSHAGGMIANIIMAIAAGATIYALTNSWEAVPTNPLALLFGGLRPDDAAMTNIAAYLYTFAAINMGIALFNLLPYYWFDGAHLLQAVLWKPLGLYRAINITCIVGMVLAVPMFILSLAGLNLLGMIMWALLFASAYQRRQLLKAQGTNEEEDAIAWSANYTGDDAVRTLKRRKGRWFKSAAKRAAQDQAEQERIDAILAKVKEKGLHSLTWFERRALKKATERQRQRDLAER